MKRNREDSRQYRIGTLGYLVAALMAICAVHATAFADEFVFETNAARYVISESGASKSLQEKKSGRELLASPGMPFALLRSGVRTFPVSHIRRIGDILRADFGQSGLSADYRITSKQDYILIELIRLDKGKVDEIRLAQLQVKELANAGALLNILWDKQFAVSLMGLSDKVDSRFGDGMLLSSVYSEYGIVGEKVALIAVPTGNFTNTVQKIERDLKLPSPRIGGSWAKTSTDVRSSYLFTDLTEANADETIRYAKLAGFKYIMIYSHIWSSSLGSYPINMQNFPLGEKSLKTVIAKCHAAGLKVGMHMLTSFISKNDAIARGKSNSRLFSDADATLSTDTDETTRVIAARSGMAHFAATGVSTDVRIDNEIIHYESIGGAGSTWLIQCTRGYAGTKAAFHRAGSKIYHLAEYGGAYLADLKTTLKDEISDRVAGLINRCGFDMIFFDGAEANCINGPCWYWTGQQELSIAKKVKRDLMVQGSAVSPWSWHLTTRGYCDDYAAIAPKQYLDHYKIDHWWNLYYRSFIPVELGWWGFLSSAADHPATTPDEAELYAVRMIALNVPVSIETSLAALKANGRTDEMLKLLGEYEQLRLSNAVPETVRRELRTGEWHLQRKDGRPQFIPVIYETAQPDENGEVLVKNEFAPQKLKFRLQAGSGLAKVGDRLNILLLPSGSELVLNQPGPDGAPPGMLAERLLFTGSGDGRVGMPMLGQSSSIVQRGTPLNLTSHRALALKIKVEGTLPKGKENSTVLNVQLESGGFYRDHFIELDFTGERTIIMTKPNPEKMLPELWPSFTTYSVKSALLGFDYKNIVSVNFRWMRQPRTNPLRCTVTLVEALAETDTILKNLEIAVGTSRVVIPVALKTGEYIEYWGEGPARVFNLNGQQIAKVEIKDVPMLGLGNNRIFLRTRGDASVKLTTIVQGSPLSW